MLWHVLVSPLGPVAGPSQEPEFAPVPAPTLSAVLGWGPALCPLAALCRWPGSSRRLRLVLSARLSPGAGCGPSRACWRPPGRSTTAWSRSSWPRGRSFSDPTFGEGAARVSLSVPWSRAPPHPGGGGRPEPLTGRGPGDSHRSNEKGPVVAEFGGRDLRWVASGCWKLPPPYRVPFGVSRLWAP